MLFKVNVFVWLVPACLVVESSIHYYILKRSAHRASKEKNKARFKFYWKYTGFKIIIYSILFLPADFAYGFHGVGHYRLIWACYFYTLVMIMLFFTCLFIDYIWPRRSNLVEDNSDAQTPPARRVDD